MRLEQILDAAYKATLPIRVIDKTVKLGYDALAAATTRVGFDRFRLAGYAAAGAGIGAVITVAGYGVAGNFGWAAFFGSVGVGYLVGATNAKNMREYLLEPKKVLGYEIESILRFIRISRYTLIGLAGLGIANAVGLSLQLPLILPTSPNQLTDVGSYISLLTVPSYLYLIDGDGPFGIRRGSLPQGLTRS